MSPTLFIYTHINQIKKHYDLGIDKNLNDDDLPYFNKFKYRDLILEGGLIRWIISECKEVNIYDEYEHEYNYYMIDELEKISELKDKIWNRQIDNYIFVDGTSALDFAYDCWDFIKNGGIIYFIV